MTQNSTETSTLGWKRRKTTFAQIPNWIIKAGSRISMNARATYAALATYADNNTGGAYPGQQKLADDLGCSVSTVHRAMKELEDFGAVEVLRRRNPKTGNYRVNHYSLVWDNPHETPSVTRENGGMSPVTAELHSAVNHTQSYYTSKQSSEGDVAPPIKDQGRQTTRAEQADPISPTFYHSKDREVLITNVQMIAHRKNEHGTYTPEVDEAAHQLEENLMTAFNEDDDVIGWMITDRDWTPPKDATSRLKAAIWLNKLLHAWQAESTRLTWRGESGQLAA